MKSNKIMRIKNLAFNLPDDFNGNVTDALELVVKYRRSNEEIYNRTIEDNAIIEESNSKDVLDEVIDGLWISPNTKLHLNAALLFFENDSWENKNERMK